MSARLLRGAPRGDGQPVLVLPGFLAGDTSTRLLRRYLKNQGFSTHPWLLGQNRGPREGVRERMVERLHSLQERYAQKVSIVGWSLGGIYARELAKEAPESVRQVVTLGSPFANVARASRATPLFDRMARNSEAADRGARAEEIRTPPDLPSTAIFTKTDGIVHWSACLEPEAPHTENIEISGSHCGLGINPTVLYAVAERLSQPDGDWRPFAVEGWRRMLYKQHKAKATR